jgi:hypothetical protein
MEKISDGIKKEDSGDGALICSEIPVFHIIH